MAKRIIFCADGTWSGPAKQTGVEPMDGDDAAGEIPPDGVTNVVKLFENLDGAITAETKALQNEHEKVLSDAAGNPLQVAKYLHGVGDSKNLLIKLLGGALGLGVIGRIVRGYTSSRATMSQGTKFTSRVSAAVLTRRVPSPE